MNALVSFSMEIYLFVFYFNLHFLCVKWDDLVFFFNLIYYVFTFIWTNLGAIATRYGVMWQRKYSKKIYENF